MVGWREKLALESKESFTVNLKLLEQNPDFKHILY